MFAIRCEGLSKQYRIGERESYKALRDVIADAAAAPFRRLRAAVGNGNGNGSSIRNPQSEIRNSFWALDDVSFEVKRGEVVGIIGRNGAGKSTLLKILSRITKPTRGHAEIHGRVGSLLEVGTGFHAELTGRENIYLNGAILGMRKAEVERKFDEIVAFASVEEFIDTPVKRYSSGMYVRLAFAVAAHMETEVLLIDEVLAVGDAEFQKKCLGKMDEAARGGRTVLFVSHNLAAVQAICNRAISIEKGQILNDGKPTEIVNEYLAGAANTPSSHCWGEHDCPQNQHIAVYEVTVEAPAGEAAITIDTGLNLRVIFQNKRDGIYVDCTISVKNRQGVTLFESGALIEPVGSARAGRYRVTTKVPGHLLNAGRYYVSVQFGLNQSHVLFKLKEVVAFDVENTATGRGANMNVTRGVIRPLLAWNQELVAGE